jgi:hypothetical protein
VHPRVLEIVDRALEQPPNLRMAFLHAACGGDADLLSQTTGELAQRSAVVPSQQDQSSAETTAVHVPGQAEFAGTQRFSLTRLLGSGGFGEVYEARDLERNDTVALKLLKNVSAEELYRFKQEFRVLADLHHENLVRLHELFSHRHYWFFTMELVGGPDFLTYVRAGGGRRHSPAEPGPVLSPASIARLISALQQLVEGLSALHNAGHLHRDVKPPNVLIAPPDRVVLLDFGLLMDLKGESAHQSGPIAGTPPYMSPEHVAGRPLSAASDWYSVGVMLYQALTGALPFSGSLLDVLEQKHRVDPPSPSTRVDGVPPQLNQLCIDLLARDPQRRPTGDDIRKRLHRSPGAVRPHHAPPAIPRAFVGREAALVTLRESFQRMLGGVTTIAAISGPSGIGKTALVRAFLNEIEQRSPGTLILTGRCYERESVPYKALDSVVDALAQYLRRLPSAETRAFLPRDIASVAQLFPVLNDLVISGSRRSTVPAEPQQVRRRAWTAIRETLGRLADTRPVVMFIDDVQWGDADSAALLNEVIRPPDAPPLFFIAAHRDVEATTSRFVRTFFRPELTRQPGFVGIQVDPLSSMEARDLATTLLPPGLGTDEMVSLIVAESTGNPFFIAELARFAELTQLAATAHPSLALANAKDREATLAHMIAARVARLSELARRVLRLTAVNGKPLSERILVKTTGGDDLTNAVTTLRFERLLRARTSDSGTELEPYHDRIREVIESTLDPQTLRECHAQLAKALEDEPSGDAELIAEHWLRAGEVSRAAEYMTIAAERADKALAFDRAARLYRSAIDLKNPDVTERSALMVRLAQALGNAGRGSEAAAVYLETPTLSEAAKLEFRQKAAHQYLFAGHLMEGMGVIREVLSQIGMTLPRSQAGTLLMLLAGRSAVRLRGLRWKERSADEIPSADLMKVDALWSVAAGLSIVDTMRGAVFQTRHLLYALRLGEPARIHRALCLEAGFVAASGIGATSRAHQVLRLATELTPIVGTPYAKAMQLLMEGTCDYLIGRWPTAAQALAGAEKRLTNECTGVTWELNSTRFFRLWTAYQLGDLATLRARFPALIKDAKDRGDRYASGAISGFFAHIVHLAADDPETAARHAREAVQHWTQTDFQMPHLWNLWSLADIALYQGHGTEAWRAVNERWGALRRSLLLEVQLMRIYMLDLKGRAATAAAFKLTASRERDQLLKVARRLARSLEREGLGWAAAMGMMIRAAAEEAEGRADTAKSLLEHAHRLLGANEMNLLATVARRRIGQLSGAGGASLLGESDEWLQSQGVRDAAALSRMFYPVTDQPVITAPPDHVNR